MSYMYMTLMIMSFEISGLRHHMIFFLVASMKSGPPFIENDHVLVVIFKTFTQNTEMC